MTTPHLLTDLQRDEGCRLDAYLDTVGVWTIGYGHTGPEVRKGLVWNQTMADAQLATDEAHHTAELRKRLPWFDGLDDVRQDVLANMAFNLGVDGLLGFKNTLAMVKRGDYAGAAENMLKSKWAAQVKGRASRLAKLMRTGARP
jgi:lysozyme